MSTSIPTVVASALAALAVVVVTAVAGAVSGGDGEHDPRQTAAPTPASSTSRLARVPGALLLDESCSGAVVVPGALTVSDDGEGVVLRLDGAPISAGNHPLHAGTYTLSWSAADGYHLDETDTSLRVGVARARCGR